MRTIMHAVLAAAFVGVMAFSAPVASKAQELCILFCLTSPDANARFEDRSRRYRRYDRDYDYDQNSEYYRERQYNRDYRYYGDYDSLANYDSYGSYVYYQRWSYYRYYYDKWNRSSTQYKGYNKAYDVR